VEAVIGPLMPEIEQMAQAQAQSQVSSLNNFIDSKFNDLLKGVKPELPPEVQKLAAPEIEKMVRDHVDSELKPQIMAAIEDEVQVIVQEKIISPLQSRVAEMVRAQMSGVKSQVGAAADALAGQVPIIGPEIKKIILESVDAVEACVQADIEGTFKNSPPKKFLISVTVNGKPVSYDVLPVVQDGRTLVPLRAIAQTMGAQVQWDDQSRSISMTRGDKTVSLGIDSTAATVNNAPVNLDVPATIVNGRTMVPARFISESLGAQVTWDQYSKTASITEKK
jgi:hypothetical protein